MAKDDAWKERYYLLEERIKKLEAKTSPMLKLLPEGRYSVVVVDVERRTSRMINENGPRYYWTLKLEIADGGAAGRFLWVNYPERVTTPFERMAKELGVDLEPDQTVLFHTSPTNLVGSFGFAQVRQVSYAGMMRNEVIELTRR